MVEGSAIVSTYTVSDSTSLDDKIFQFRTQIYDHLQDFENVRLQVCSFRDSFKILFASSGV
jgi:hypothetical protein